MAGLGGQQTVVAELLELPGLRPDVAQRRRHDSGVDLHAPERLVGRIHR